MRIACHILAYNVDLFIDHVLENAAPHVGKIFVTYSLRPWGYIPQSRATKTNPTTLGRVREAILRLRSVTGLQTEIEIIQGEWETDEGTRNACLAAATEQGFDWLIVQDADEFYTPAAWKMAKDALHADQTSECVQTTWYLFWKSSHFVIQDRTGAIKSTNTCFAIRCDNRTGFRVSRTTDAARITVVDAPCFHYSYVMTDDQMVEKVTTWSHAHQFDARRWLAYKWFSWTPQTRNIAPINPVEWPRAIRFPGEQPAFSRYFALPLRIDETTSLGDRVGAALWDLRSEWRTAARDAKRFVMGRPG